MRLTSTNLRRVVRSTLIPAIALAMSWTGLASAQIGELAGFTEAMQPEYLSRDLAVIDTSLELDSTQREILENLYEDYRSNFQQGIDAMQEQLKEMKEQLRSSDHREILSMIFVPFEEWGRQREVLGQDFLGHIQMMLSEDQQDRWPAFTRRLVREKTLSKGVLGGESVDLLLLVRDLDLSRPILLTLQPVLDEYEMTLDEALRRRNEIVRSTQGKIVEALQGDNNQNSLRLIDQQLTAREAVREVNDRYTEIISAALPGEYSDTFRIAALERAYPKAYRLTPGQKMYMAATKIEGLEEEILQNVLDLQEALNLEMAMLADQIAEEMRRHEPKKTRHRVETYVARVSGAKRKKLTDPTVAVIRERDQMDNRFIGLLQSILLPEEFSSLPGADRWLRQKDAAAKRKDNAKQRANKAAEMRQKKQQMQGERGRQRGGERGDPRRPDRDAGGNRGRERDRKSGKELPPR